jgi:predicted Ser/Thr protein kinase
MSDQSAQGESLTGKTLGQYEIGEQLGQGGMATVYLARQKNIDRTVAIKIMPHYFMGDPSFLKRFEQEVKVIAGLAHPHVLPVHDYGEIDGRPYIVMAHMSGGTLADRIRQGPMPTRDVVKLIAQIADGLDLAHRKGIIHRDFKPSNVLLDENGNAYLADFGIAKVSESNLQLTGSGMVGTPAYMAPEMGESGMVTAAIDIYALGITLYQMLTGRYPFQGDTPIRVMMAHAQDPIPDVREARPELPEAVSQVVKKAMAKRPEDRFSTAHDLAEALRTAITAPAAAATGVHIPAANEPMTQPVATPPTRPPDPTPYMAAPPAQQFTTPPPVPVQQKRGGCSPVVMIGGILVLVVCVGGGIALGGLTLLGGLLGGTGQVELVNNYGADICDVYFSEAGSSEWGTDWLSEGDLIATGDSRTFIGVTAGETDIRADDCNGNSVSQNFGTEIGVTETYTWTIDPPPVIEEGDEEFASLELINESGSDICVIFIRPAGSVEWGDNQVDDGEVITTGSSYTVHDIPPDTYDIREESCDDEYFAEELDWDLSGENSWTINPPD